MLRPDLVYLYGTIIALYALSVLSDPPGHAVTQTMLVVLALIVALQSSGGGA